MSSLRCKVLRIVINFLFLWFICLSSFLVYFKNGPECFTWGMLMLFQLQSLISKCFPVRLRYSFLFSYISVFHSVRFPDFQVLVIFLLFPNPDALLICQFYSFRCFYFPTVHDQHDTFINSKFHSYSLAVYSYCLCHCHKFFFFYFGKYLDNIYKVSNLFL